MFASRCRWRTPAQILSFVLVLAIAVMARWPRHTWTTVFTYGLIFVGFPLLCLLTYAFVKGWLF